MARRKQISSKQGGVHRSKNAARRGEKSGARARRSLISRLKFW
ncbi:MAG TPA: hypothetical protein VJ755_11035 [Gemmatimonadales bacterium]|nr:hypothetical protein [Gemmatimonadales bacterium]